MATATFIEKEDLLKLQAEAERKFMADFHERKYTFEDPKVVYNPYLINPCAALVMFRTDRPVAVTVEVEGKTPEYSIRHTYSPTTVHIHPVLGLYDNCENTIHLTQYQGPTKTIKITTAAAPLTTDIVSMTGCTEILNDQLVVLIPALWGYPTGVDGNGDIRWYLSENQMIGGKKLRNGHFLTGTNRKIKQPYYSSGLYEMDMIGKIYREYRIPGLYHHDFAEMDDGNLLILTQSFEEGSDSVEDMCALVDRGTGEVLRTIDYKDFLPRGAAPSGCWTEEDWVHNNALAYDRYTNSVIFSCRHMDCMVNIDLDTEKINWIIGDPDQWPEEYQKYFFTPEEPDAFEWQYEQHAVVLTPDGDVMCFDNGHWRSKRRENYLANDDNYSRGVRFRIDTEHHTIRQIWEYGKERGAEFFSQYISNVEFYGENHYLVHSGGIMRKDGKNTDGFFLPAGENADGLWSTTVEVYGTNVMWELRTSHNFYRATKLSLYQDGPNLSMESGVHLGTLFSSSVLEGKTLQAPVTELPEEIRLNIVDEFDCFTVMGRFEKNAEVTLYLEKDDEIKAYRLPTVQDGFASFSCLPYLEAHPDNKRHTITKFGLHGTYHICLSVEDHCYDTGVDITCI